MQALLTVLSGVSATVPILVFLYLIWWLDRYDREPVAVLLGTFAWGATGAVLLSLILSTILLGILSSVVSPVTAGSVGAVVIAPLIEEPMKALVLIPLCLRRDFDNTTDGFVYGAAAGLGFGMTENFLYFLDSASTGDLGVWMSTVAIRTLYSALMHAGATSVVGAALGLAKFRGPLFKALAIPAGLVLAMGIHALWNGLLTLDSVAGTGGALTMLNLLLFPLEFLALFVVLQVCLWDERKTIHRELSDEVISGLIPPDDVPMLASYFARQRRDWLPAGVDHHAYVRAATALAFRKHQARASGDRSYEADAQAMRAEIHRLLAPA